MATQIKKEGPLRKRGRPQGKGRAPLSLEERRARNAQYERERRNENAAAMAELAEAAGCDSGITNAELIATVVALFQRHSSNSDSSDDLNALRRTNQKLMEQLQNLEYRIATDPELAGLTIPEDSDEEEYSQCPMRTHANNIGRKKIKMETVPKLEPTDSCNDFARPAPVQRKRSLKPNPPEDAVTEPPLKTEFVAVQTMPVVFENHMIPKVEEIQEMPSTSGSAEPGILDALQASWPEAEVKLQVDVHNDGVLEYMRQWSVEDFVTEYL